MENVSGGPRMILKQTPPRWLLKHSLIIGRQFCPANMLLSTSTAVDPTVAEFTSHSPPL